MNLIQIMKKVEIAIMGEKKPKDHWKKYKKSKS
jgi:hypothetical protein